MVVKPIREESARKQAKGVIPTFTIDNKKNITMTQGDTGHFIIRPTGIELTGGEVALFTVKSDRGELKMQKVYDIENGMIQIDFENDDTDKWAPGKYRWEMRYCVNPVYDEESGQMISADEVYAPRRSSGTRLIIVEEALGKV